MDLSDILPQIVLILGVIGLGGLILAWWRMSRPSAARRRPAPGASEPPARQRREEVLAISAELTDHAQRLMDRLELHEARLERLILEADDRLGRLDAGLRVWPPRTGAAPAEAIIEPRGPAPTAAPPTATSGRADALSQAVYALADAGRSTIDIARELQEQIGKVQLILALREDRGR